MNRNLIKAVLPPMIAAGLCTAAAPVLVAAPSGPPRPFVFTQMHQDDAPLWLGKWTPQCVPVGAPIQIQLPGTPTVWTVARIDTEPGSAIAPHVVRSVIPSPNRYIEPCAEAGVGDYARCPSEIYQFDLQAPQLGATTLRVVIEGSPPSPIPAMLAKAQEGGFHRYTLTLNVRADCAPER